MSYINELRRNTPLAGGVANLLALDGDTDGILAVAPEMHAIVDPWGPPEFALFRQEYLFSGTFAVAIGAGRSIGQLFNSSTDAIVVIEAGSRFNTTAGEIQLARTSTQLTTDVGFGAIARDGRFARPTVPYVDFRSQNGVALPASVSAGLFFTTGSIAYDLAFPIILRPQGTLCVYPSADALLMVVNFVGRVRRGLTPRELSP